MFFLYKYTQEFFIGLFQFPLTRVPTFEDVELNDGHGHHIDMNMAKVLVNGMVFTQRLHDHLR